MDLAKRGSEGYGVGLVRSTSFGRKRVALFDFGIGFGDVDDCGPVTPLKRQCSRDCLLKSALEDLPQEILVRILCGVEHDDLKRLFCVSRTIREAALIAKESHFAYSTPLKGVVLMENFGECDDVPNAPKQSRVSRLRLSAKKLADISVVLFSSDTEAVWPKKRDLFMEVEEEEEI